MLLLNYTDFAMFQLKQMEQQCILKQMATTIHAIYSYYVQKHESHLNAIFLPRMELCEVLLFTRLVVIS